MDGTWSQKTILFAQPCSSTPREAPWRSDMNHVATMLQPCVLEGQGLPGQVVVAPRDGRPTLRVAYFFAGHSRKASIGEELRKLCETSEHGFQEDKIDISNRIKAHDLLDGETRDKWEAKVADGENDFVILSPPCALEPRPVRWSTQP